MRFPDPPRRTFAISAMTLLILLASGCSIVPAYRKPDAPIPAQWMTPSETPGAAGTTGAAGTPATAATAATALPPSVVARVFWSGFGSPQLDALLQYGLVSGPDVAIARARLEQAKGAADVAGSSASPTLGIGADLSRGSTSGKRSTSVTFQAGFTPDLWGALDARTQSAGEGARATEFDLVSVQRNLLSQIAAQYFAVRACEERLRLAQLVADDASRLLGLVERQASLGAASALDVAQQRNAVQTLQAATPALRQQRVAAVAQLAVLVDVPPVMLKLDGEPLLQLTVPDVVAVSPADVVDARPEVQAAEARLRAANFDVGAARAAFLPSLSITASAGWLLNPTAAAWGVAGSLLQPLFDGGQRKGQLRIETGKSAEMLASYRQTLLQVLQQTETQLAAVAQLKEQERFDAAAVDSAQESLRLARIRYERGASDLLAVLLSQKTLAQAQDTLVQVRQQRLQAAAALFVATGGRTLPVDTSSTASVRPDPRIADASHAPDTTIHAHSNRSFDAGRPLQGVAP